MLLLHMLIRLMRSLSAIVHHFSLGEISGAAREARHVMRPCLPVSHWFILLNAPAALKSITSVEHAMQYRYQRIDIRKRVVHRQ
jgi:hypothetical protein